MIAVIKPVNRIPKELKPGMLFRTVGKWIYQDEQVFDIAVVGDGYVSAFGCRFNPDGTETLERSPWFRSSISNFYEHLNKGTLEMISVCWMNTK